MPRFSRSFVILLLVLLLLPVAVQAAEPQSVHSAPSSWMSWDVPARLWNLLTGAQTDNGCEVDPNGRCRPSASTMAITANGCQVDPDGRCRLGTNTTATTDNGCLIEPDGRCRN